MKIADHDLDEKVFVIAELSSNHNQDIDLARRAVEVASEAGCDAIKVQTYTPDTMTLNVAGDSFVASDLWGGEHMYALYERAYLPWEWHKELRDYADELGILFFSSPFDRNAVDLLEKLDVPAYKIASYEITDIPLIKYVAEKGKPVIFSTGLSDVEDISLAIETCQAAGNNDIVLLKCTSSYPALPETMNLKTIVDLTNRFNVPVGLSDHSLGVDAVIAAIALGARVIEKHFTPAPEIDTPDRAFSLTPSELQGMVKHVRTTEKMLGTVDYSSNARKYARSLFAVRDIEAGESFNDSNVRSIRPGDGLHPKYYPLVMESVAACKIHKGTPLSKTMLKKITRC